MESLKNEIGNGKYSILLDESTDISVCKYLGLAINYFSVEKGDVVSTFLQLTPLIQCDAVRIVSALKSSLQSFDLKLANMVGIGTDNASVMLGINNGVFAKLKAEIFFLGVSKMWKRLSVS